MASSSLNIYDVIATYWLQFAIGVAAGTAGFSTAMFIRRVRLTAEMLLSASLSPRICRTRRNRRRQSLSGAGIPRWMFATFASPPFQVPILVVQRSGDRWIKPDEGRYLADHKGGGDKYAVLSGNDPVIWVGDSDRALDEIEEFLTGVCPPPVSERVLLTVLFTDIVGSTSVVAAMGDRRWRELLQRHDDDIRNELRRYDGTEVKTTGDGFLAAFHDPTKAIQCARTLQSHMAGIGLSIRTALHTGECEKRGKDLSGIAVHLASRLLDHAQAGDVIVSRTVKELVVGSGFSFEERGEATLRDVPGTWQLYSVRTAPVSEQPCEVDCTSHYLSSPNVYHAHLRTAGWCLDCNDE